MQRLIGEHLSTVPQITLTISHLDLVSRLGRTTLIGSKLPAQARLFAINPQWIELIFTTKILNAKRRHGYRIHSFYPSSSGYPSPFVVAQFIALGAPKRRWQGSRAQ